MASPCPIRRAIEALEPRLLLATYYVDADALPGGNGSVGTPWNAIAQVNAATLAPGDQVLFQRGDTFRSTLIPKTNGALNNHIVFGAYGTGATPRILGSDTFSTWFPVAGLTNVWQINLPSASRMVAVDGVGLQLERTQLPANLGPGEFVYNVASKYVQIYSTVNPNSLAVEVAQRKNAVYAGTNRKYITLQDLELGGCNGSAVLVNAGSTDWIVQRNLVRFCNSTAASDNNPGAGITPGGARVQVLDNTIHFVVGDAIYSQSSPDVTIARNTITGIYTFGTTYTGDAIQITGTAPDRFQILDNNIDIRDSDTGKGAIMTEFGADGIIRGNRVRGGKFGIEFNAARNLIENNIVSEAGQNGGFRTANDNNADGITVRNNLVYDISGPGFFITNDTAVSDKQRSNLRILNNTFVGTGGVSQSYTAISGEFRNNIIQQANGDYLLSVGRIIAGQSFVASNNLYYETNSASSKLVKIGAAEAAISFTAGSGISIAGVPTGVVPLINTGYNLLLRIDRAPSGNTVRLWVNPDLAAGEAALGSAAATAVTSSNWSINSISTSHSSDSNNESGFDNIRLGNTFADAAGTGTPLAEENFNTYTSGQLINNLNGGTGWAGPWKASNTASKITSGLSMTTKGDTKRALASPIAGTSGSVWAFVRMSSQSSARTSTFQFHNDLGTQFFDIADANASGAETASLSAVPGFVSLAADDYHLAAGSPAIDAGITVPGVTTDFEGDPRPLGVAPDIGADERPLFAYLVGTVAHLDFDGTATPVTVTPGNSGALAFTLGPTTIALPGPITALVVAGSPAADVLNWNGPVSPPATFSSAGGADAINVSAGVFTLASDAGASGATVSLTATGSGAFAFQSAQTLESLILTGSAQASAAPGGGFTLFTRALSLSGSAALSVADNDLLLDYAPTAPSPLSNVNGWLLNGLTGATAPRILTLESPTSGPDAGRSTTLAFFDNSIQNLPSWESTPIDPATIVGKFTFFGDANLDGMVNDSDYSVIDAFIGLTASSWLFGDLNFDGATDDADYSVIDAAIGGGASSPLATPRAGLAFSAPPPPTRTPLFADDPDAIASLWASLPVKP